MSEKSVAEGICSTRLQIKILPSRPWNFASYQGLRVKNFNFTSTLSGPNATLTVMAYMFQDEGNITFGNETSEMRKGMLKFNIQVEGGIVNRVSIKS